MLTPDQKTEFYHLIDNIVMAAKKKVWSEEICGYPKCELSIALDNYEGFLQKAMLTNDDSRGKIDV